MNCHKKNRDVTPPLPVQEHKKHTGRDTQVHRHTHSHTHPFLITPWLTPGRDMTLTGIALTSLFFFIVSLPKQQSLILLILIIYCSKYYDIQQVFCCVWLLLLNITSWRFIHVVSVVIQFYGLLIIDYSMEWIDTNFYPFYI